jgi:iron uptake system EfeUOB component EfeO/EfeM
MFPDFPCRVRIFALRPDRICYGLHTLILLALLASAPSLFGAASGSKSQTRIQISTALPPATLGVSYDEVISVSGGTAPYQFVSQNLPPGMALNPTTGQITGTPQSNGPFSFSVEVFDAKGNHKTQKLTLAVGSQMGVAIALNPTSATVNSSAIAQFQATVTHTWNTAVTWTASTGTVSSTGLYTAPAVTANTTAVLTAVSVADSTKFASASIFIVAAIVGITLSPTTTTVNAVSSAQLQASVTNTSNTAVNWSASSGTISSTGLYTAPAVTSNTTAVLTATSAADSTKSAIANISIVAPVSLTLSPTSTSVNAGSTAQFQAAVSNSTNTAVNWTASTGTVSSSGLYTAPKVTTNTTAVLTATSAADSTKFASATISIVAPVAISLSPGDTTVNSASTAQFQAAVANTSNTSVTWTASTGTVSTTGLYTAPTVTSSTTAILTATSTADSTKSASVNITIAAPVTISLSPNTTNVDSGSTAQFQASITNTSNTSVNWTASTGTVSSSGLYTAPAITANTTAVLTATSAADSTKSATASIALIAPVAVGITLSPGTASVNSGLTTQFQASVTNTSNTAVTWTASTGTVSSSGLYTAPAVKANTTAVLTATSTADTTKTATASISIVATARISLEVLYPPTNPHTSDFQAVQAYVMSNPAVTGGNLAVEWGVIDQGPTANPQYNWSALDALIIPWVAAGKKVNLIVWANSDNTTSPCTNGVANATGNCGIPAYVWTALGPSNYVTCSTQYGNQQIPNYLNQAGFQLPYQQFMTAMVQKYGSDPDIGYIRFGLGHGGETMPVASWNDATTACGKAFAAWGYTITAWESYLAGMLNYEGNLHSPKQLMVGVTPMGSPTTQVPDYAAPIAASMGIGFGSQGFELSDITGYPNCVADWCNLFARYGQVPLELQTYLQSCPDNTCTTGSLVNLIPFAIAHHASVLEIYYQDWLVAFASGYPGNSQYGGAYAQVLTTAANSNVQ